MLHVEAEPWLTVEVGSLSIVEVDILIKEVLVDAHSLSCLFLLKYNTGLSAALRTVQTTSDISQL